ncbi:pyruvate, phosphate dikinase [Alterileibacterium massiliense]|uniref:pyruvate, phosphate dikinase n=1 Tax=Alterileibacterium massiliense TaxID=1870997 RepID=UPI0008D9C3E6|nr:pyruvate, phosphate dikinase [Alterileibacterium massiliense]
MEKFVYSFNEGSQDMKNLLGGKGAGLAEMTKIGLPVPFGFTITTSACKIYSDKGKLDDEIIKDVYAHLEELEQVAGKKFGDDKNPLLVSVRSGAPISMPGMMDTILNLGLNDVSVEGLAKKTENDRFAYDSYRRFIQMFGDVVMEIDKKKFDEVFDGQKKKVGAEFDVDLTTEDLKAIIDGYKKVVKKELGRDFPQDPMDQLMEAINAVFRSWNNDRAILYRKLNDIPDSLGTAVNVQSMVFGNTGNNSGTGVAFTRSPVNGENRVFGEFLVNAQGEDVVAGIRTPQPIAEMKEAFPDVYRQFDEVAHILENHYKDMQDMEFTVEDGKLFMLQTRSGKRTAAAAIKVAVDMVNDGLITKEEAIMRIEPDQINQLLHPNFDPAELSSAKAIAKGLPASPGAATGQLVFHAEDAAEWKKDGKKVILVREETSPEDLAGMVAAEGILTARGGMTSHAAVVARGMGKCCVAGCSAIIVDEESRTMKVSGKVYKEGDKFSINGTDGSVYAEEIKTIPPELSGNFATVIGWADDIRQIGIRTNADNPRDAKQAVDFGAEGIGLCRTEHMFFEDERIPKIRRMILADTEEERREALKGLLPYQTEDFREIYKVMGERPVTIRLLDPPLHEFLPHNEAERKQLCEQFNIPMEVIEKKTIELHEFNPMLGHRGCRLAVTYPEIAEMQTTAIINAALDVKKETGIDIKPEIMVPLVGIPNELKQVKKTIDETIKKIFEERGEKLDYLVGTMIEIPRAALLADEIAEDAEFFSFGTNDLTQMGFGFSRDDTGKIISEYVDRGVLEEDPFQSLDQHGIGKLVEFAVQGGKKTRPNIKLGICGEHGGDPKSIEFCYRAGLNYVSCSPFRVPIARLAAAQATLRNSENKN